MQNTSRAWCFTIFSKVPGRAPPQIEDSMHIKYCIYQLEKCESSGRLHLQGCIKFKVPIRMPQAKSFLGVQDAHLEVCRDWEASKRYCTKEDTRVEGPWELGTDTKQGQRSDIETITEKLRNGARIKRIAEEHPREFVKFHKGFQAYKAAVDQPMHGAKTCILLIGATGVGKTRFVMDIFKDVYNVFDISKPWYDGYDGHEVMLLDECGAGNIMHYNLLKQLTDRYALTIPVKGHSVPLKAKFIFMTSNERMEEWWPNVAGIHLEALRRRIQTFYLPHDHQKLTDYVKTVIGTVAHQMQAAEDIPQAEDDIQCLDFNVLESPAKPWHPIVLKKPPTTPITVTDEEDLPPLPDLLTGTDDEVAQLLLGTGPFRCVDRPIIPPPGSIKKYAATNIRKTLQEARHTRVQRTLTCMAQLSKTMDEASEDSD